MSSVDTDVRPHSLAVHLCKDLGLTASHQSTLTRMQHKEQKISQTFFLIIMLLTCKHSTLILASNNLMMLLLMFSHFGSLFKLIFLVIHFIVVDLIQFIRWLSTHATLKWL